MIPLDFSACDQLRVMSGGSRCHQPFPAPSSASVLGSRLWSWSCWWAQSRVGLCQELVFHKASEGRREEHSVNNSGSPYHHSYRLMKILGCSFCRNSSLEFLLLKVRLGCFQVWRLKSLLQPQTQSLAPPAVKRSHPDPALAPLGLFPPHPTFHVPEAAASSSSSLWYQPWLC